ncbi:hypothetical protein G6F65_016084 [Rhizopus arrhizus]|nr:hypothetical protein G6F65_016084 [Rhizopus arrhizus]
MTLVDQHRHARQMPDGLQAVAQWLRRQCEFIALAAQAVRRRGGRRRGAARQDGHPQTQETHANQRQHTERCRGTYHCAIWTSGNGMGRRTPGQGYAGQQASSAR